MGNIRLSYKLDGMGIDGFNNGTTGSWEAHSSTISNENDRLKVVLSDADVGVFKIVSAAAGETLAISLDVDRGTTDKVSLYEYGAGKLYDLVNGYNQISYTPTVSGDFILLIVKDPTSNDVGTQTHFYLDNIGVTIGEEELVIVEENNFYPFGMVQKGYNNVVNGTEHPYTYNGKEEQNELGLNWIDYGARNYDASLGRWMNIDRFSEGYYTLSPYNYTANTPSSLFDINGDYFTDPFGHIDKLKSRIDLKQKSYGQKINDLDKQISEKASNGENTSDLENKRDNLTSAQAELTSTLSEINELETSDQEYKIGTVIREGSNGSTELSKNAQTIHINFNNSLGTDNYGYLAHELKHAFQFEKNRLSLTPGGGDGNLNDIQNEIEAFRREMSLNAVYDLGNINEAYVRKRGLLSTPQSYQTLLSKITETQRTGYIQILRRKIAKSNASNEIPKEVIKGWQNIKN